MSGTQVFGLLFTSLQTDKDAEGVAHSFPTKGKREKERDTAKKKRTTQKKRTGAGVRVGARKHSLE